MNLLEDESGLSVVVGTLLLILVVVASVSTLALMASETQKKEMEQNSLRAAVESENLTIPSLALNDSDGDGYWNTMIITIANLHTEEARIVGLNINDRNAANYTDGVREYNFQNQLPVPSGRSSIFLNLTSNFTSPLNISKNDAIRVILITSLTNKFERDFLPPVPIIKANVKSEQIGSGFHYVLILDGSDSLDREGTIIDYQWLVRNGTNGTSILGNLRGQKARMNFNPTNTGKFWVDLNVTDSNGMLGSTSQDYHGTGSGGGSGGSGGGGGGGGSGGSGGGGGGGGSSSYAPPASANLTSTQGNFWINYTWDAGAGNITNSYNVSVNGTWTNGTVNNSINTTVDPHGWSNITVWAYNNSGGGSLNSTSVSQNTQVANNLPVQALIGNKTVNEGQSLIFTVNAADADNDTITYGTNATKGTFNTTTGNFSWTTNYGDAGVYIWYFNSSDSYGGVASETINVTVNNVSLSIISSSPVSDPTTTIGTTQPFGISLNRTANVTWYINGSIVQINSSVSSANYTNSTAGIGEYNVTAIANDSYYTASRTWNWTVVAQPTYNVSGYVFDNYGSGLEGVLVQNGSNQNTTLSSGYYLIAGLLNGTYNLNYSKTGFNTGYSEVTINGTDVINANITIYDTIPPASVSNPNTTTGNSFINNTWTNPADIDFNYTWFRYSNGTNLQNVSKPTNYLNLTWSPHYTQNISAQTVDSYGNTNQTKIWFNATIPNNPPVQASIGNKDITAGDLLTFTVSATDTDNDTITYGTNATKGTLSATTGVYSWQTGSNDTGTYIWYFNSSDSYGGVAGETITVTVASAPIINYIPPAPVNITSTQGSFWINNSWQAGAGNVTDSYNVSVNGSWMNGTTSTYYNDTIRPHGWSNITVWAHNDSDGGSLSSAPVSQSTQVANNAPIQAAIGNKSVDEGQWLNFTINATDIDNDLVIYGTNATKGIFNTTTGNFSWQTTYSDAGTYDWYFNSSDDYGGVASKIITVTVNNIPLSITSFSPLSDPTTTQGTAQTFNVTLNRTANVTWYMNGAQVQTNIGTTAVSYTNSTAAAGTWNVTASVTDDIDTTSAVWNWTVNALQPITYIPPNPINLQNTTDNFWVNHTWLPGTGNTTDSYNVSVNGTWYDGTTNTYYNNTVGPHGWSNITVWAYNSSSAGSLSAGSISQNTQVPNNPPAQNPIGNKTVTAGGLLTFTVSATDADNDTITYGTNATNGTFNTTTGNYSWQTNLSDTGTYEWYFNSSDNYGGIAIENVTISVN